MKLFFVFSAAASTSTTTTTVLLLLLLSFSTLVVDVVDAQDQGQPQGQGGGGRPSWAGQQGGKDKGRPNGGGGQGQGGLFKGGFGNNNNKNNKNNGNKFGLNKNLGKTLQEFGDMTCAGLQEEYSFRDPVTTTLSRRQANKQRKGIRTLLCLKKCSTSTAVFPKVEVECEPEFAQNLCDRIAMQATKAQKKATGLESRAEKGSVPEHVRKRLTNKANRMMEMTVQLLEQRDLLNPYCISI